MFLNDTIARPIIVPATHPRPFIQMQLQNWTIGKRIPVAGGMLRLVRLLANGLARNMLSVIRQQAVPARSLVDSAQGTPS